MPLTPGSRLGPYEVLSAIGAGGMGEVYRAKDPRLGRDVAIKVLPPSFSADADRLRRFEQEARAAGVLNHPNITAVHDIGQHEGAPYVVQELLEGETLRSVLAGSKLSTRKAIEYSLQIVHGLSAAHEKGIVHRDLKPENIFVTNDGRVKILDFGLAKLTLMEGKDQGTNLPTATQGTEPGVVMGTLGYMSPEQVRGRTADARSDIFSFGAILYEMLAGRRAFLGDSAADTMSAILKEDPPDLSVTNQNISPGLERIVRHCLEKSPEQRFHSAHDVAFDLEAVSGVSAAGRADTTASAKHGGSIWKWALAGVAAAAVIGLALFLGGRLGSPSAARFRRLTYHRGYIESARFSPDGQTVVYGSTRGDQPLRTYSTRLDSVESRPMDLPPETTVLGISRTGEMVLLLRSGHHGFFIRSGTLARAALGGGNPREILEHVADADISPDGKDLAIVREVGKHQRLEFPAGKLILETEGWVSEPRISPDGTRIAFLEHPFYGNDEGFVAVAPRGGTSKRVSIEWQGVQGLAWSPDGKEIWFTGGGDDDVNGARYQLFALSPGGKHRLIYGPPTDLRLYDISPTGRVLLAALSTRGEVGGFLRGDAKERDLSIWSDEALAGITADGSAYTGLEQSAPGAGLEPIFYYRRANEAAPVRLGSGTPVGMSPDGRWVVALTRSEKGWAMSLYPTGPGEPRLVSTGAMEPRPVIQEFARWSADGRRLLVPGGERGRPSRTWLFDLEGNAAPRPVTPEGSSLAVLSPEADSVAAVDPLGKIMIYPVAGGAPKEVPGVVPGEIPVEWEASGKALFLWDRTWPARVTRLELDSGKRTTWKELATDTTGLLYGNLIVTRDGQHYIYRLRRILCELNLADGLK